MGKHIYVRQHGDRLYYSEPERSGGYRVKLWTHDSSKDDNGADKVIYGILAAASGLIILIIGLCL
jgi:hypothetical protein